jgi:hypothetical protein
MKRLLIEKLGMILKFSKNVLKEGQIISTPSLTKLTKKSIALIEDHQIEMLFLYTVLWVDHARQLV